jgi:hypothetical protein
MTAGAVAEIVGLVFAVSAQPHLFDAINIYNDGVKPGGQPLERDTPPPAPAAPAPASP